MKLLLSLFRKLEAAFGGFAAKVDALERKAMGQFLENCDPRLLEEEGQRLLLKTFHRAAERVPAYKAILAEHKLSHESVHTLDDFSNKVPLTSKENTFLRHAIGDLCIDGKLCDVADIVTSSGQSGKFAYGLTGDKEILATCRGIDFILNYHFEVARRRTLLVNVLPMGVKIASTLCTVADVSVREDMALSIIKQFSKEYDQVILLGDPNFTKLILEEGQERYGIDWKSMLIHVVIGEEFVSESWRNYIAGLIGSDDPADNSKGMVAFTMGAAELGVNFLFEAPDLIRLRQRMRLDAHLRDTFTAPGFGFAPMLYHYLPVSYHVDTIPIDVRLQEIVVTTVDPNRMLPLLRYRTGDMGRVFSHRELSYKLRELKLEEYIPRLRLPVVVIIGRNEHVSLRKYFCAQSPAKIKETLYCNSMVAASTTGNFRMSKRGSRLRLQVQRRRHAKADLKVLACCLEKELRENMKCQYNHPYFQALCAYLRGEALPENTPDEYIHIYEDIVRQEEAARDFLETTGGFQRSDADILEVQFYDYNDFPYPVDWERKILYIAPENKGRFEDW